MVTDVSMLSPNPEAHEVKSVSHHAQPLYLLTAWLVQLVIIKGGWRSKTK